VIAEELLPHKRIKRAIVRIAELSRSAPASQTGLSRRSAICRSARCAGRNNDLIKTELAHSFNDELDVIVDGGMLIRRDIIEADAMATIVPRLGRRSPAGSSEVRQIFPATLYAGQAGLCGLGQRAGEGDARTGWVPQPL
jgi:hypothetical protein